jgi:hypothetical protein
MTARGAIAATLVVLAVVCQANLRTLANGDHPGIRDVHSGPAGPYWVLLRTDPVGDVLHFNVSVSAKVPGTRDQYYDVPVTYSMTATRNGGGSAGPVTVSAMLSDNVAFDFPVTNGGAWQFELAIRSSVGDETVSVDLDVQSASGEAAVAQEQGPIRVVGIITISALGLLTVASVAWWWRLRPGASRNSR